jgi:hypothetical protein
VSFWAAFGVGAAGAFATEFLPIHSLRYTPRTDWPDWVTSASYWFLSIAGFVVGGAVAGGYATQTTMTWYLAANVGAAWPSIMNALARAAPPLHPPSDRVS